MVFGALDIRFFFLGADEDRPGEKKRYGEDQNGGFFRFHGISSFLMVPVVLACLQL
jgi:hypothetical protein